MAQLQFFGAIAIEGSSLVPVGKQILWRDGQPVWCGALGAPIEDVEFDRVTVSPEDFAYAIAITRALNQ